MFQLIASIVVGILIGTGAEDALVGAISMAVAYFLIGLFQEETKLLSFDTWNSKHGYFLSWRRIYRKGKWTPFCRVGKRYDSWSGYWKALDPTTYELFVKWEDQ